MVILLVRIPAAYFQAQAILQTNFVQKRYAAQYDMTLKYDALHAGKLLLIIYADASFAANEDGASHIGFIGLPGDRTGGLPVRLPSKVRLIHCGR